MTLEELQQQEWFGMVSLAFYTIFLMLIYWAIMGGYRHYAQLRNRLRVWEDSMKKSRKYKREMRAACDAITHALEGAAYDGKITQAYKQTLYQQLAIKCGLIDLLPKKWGLVPISSNTKENIRNRLGPDVEVRLAKMKATKTPKKLDSNLTMLQARLNKSA